MLATEVNLIQFLFCNVSTNMYMVLIKEHFQVLILRICDHESSSKVSSASILRKEDHCVTND